MADHIDKGANYAKIAFWILFCFIFLIIGVGFIIWCLGKSGGYER